MNTTQTVPDLTSCPSYLQKEYKKDLELEVKGKGMTVLEDTPDLLRVKNAGQILNEVPLELVLLVPSYSLSQSVSRSGILSVLLNSHSIRLWLWCTKCLKCHTESLQD